MVKRGSERDDIKDLLATLKKAARANSARVWRKCAEMLGKSSRRRVEINLGKINKFSEKDETVLIPGKVLSLGALDHAVTIACLSISKPAQAKATAAGASVVTIQKLVQQNPSGNKVRILA